MAKSSVEVYEKLKSTVGEEGAKALIEYVDFNIEKTAVTKLDLTHVENNMQVEINNLRTDMKEIENSLRIDMKEMGNSLKMEIKDLDHRMKLYFLLVAALIVISNPKVIDLVGRVLGVVK